MAYDAFISYRRSDGSRTAQWLRRELQSFRLPRALRADLGRPVKLYLDTACERGTADFYENNIRPALLAARSLFVIATPDARRRPAGTEDWIQRDVAPISPPAPTAATSWQFAAQAHSMIRSRPT